MYLSYILLFLAVIWCMRWGGESLRLHFYSISKGQFLSYHAYIMCFLLASGGVTIPWVSKLYTSGKWVQILSLPAVLHSISLGSPTHSLNQLNYLPTPNNIRNHWLTSKPNYSQWYNVLHMLCYLQMIGYRKLMSKKLQFFLLVV